MKSYSSHQFVELDGIMLTSKKKKTNTHADFICLREAKQGNSTDQW